MLPGGRQVKFTPKFVSPNWLPRGCLARPFRSEARGSGNVNIGARAGADTASMAAAEKSLGIVTPKPIACAKSKEPIADIADAAGPRLVRTLRPSAPAATNRSLCNHA